MNCGVVCRHGSDPMLLCLWHRPAAIALIGPLAWEPPCATGADLKRKKKKICCWHSLLACTCDREPHPLNIKRSLSRLLLHPPGLPGGHGPFYSPYSPPSVCKMHSRPLERESVMPFSQARLNEEVMSLKVRHSWYRDAHCVTQH